MRGDIKSLEESGEGGFLEEASFQESSIWINEQNHERVLNLYKLEINHLKLNPTKKQEAFLSYFRNFSVRVVMHSHSS